MTEVPEYLLQRSRERRAALGLGPEGEGGGESGGGQAAGAAAPARAEPSAPAPATAPPPPEPEPEPEPPPPYVLEEERRPKIPWWALPVLIALPFWALVYAGTLDEPPAAAAPDDPLVLGEEIYVANCASCHGATGGGGVGPALAGDAVETTFPEQADHLEFVRQGSSPGETYGAQDQEATGGMPSWEGVLTEEELEAVVTYEREGLG